MIEAYEYRLKFWRACVLFLLSVIFWLSINCNDKVRKIEQKIDRLAIELGYTKGEI